MKTEIPAALVLTDLEPRPVTLETEFIAGLRQRPKTLPCKFFYDERGSRLFEEICELDEYYLTRTETAILRDNIQEISARCGPRCLLAELGSGNSSKTRLLLEHLDSPVAYVPIDISRAHLMRAAHAVNGDYFPLEVLPVCADYSRPLRLPPTSRPPQKKVLFFPGSTLGNFEPSQAAAFLRKLAAWCEPGDGLLIGIDLQKDTSVIEAAYNDARGVTAEFNLNLLRRANTELGANFSLNQFAHRAVYNPVHSRIEMHLVSRRRQSVRVADAQFHFEPGEFITTEYSYKYSLRKFRELCFRAGWPVHHTWLDAQRWFSVHYLVCAPLRA